MRGSRGGGGLESEHPPPPPLKNYKTIGQYWSGSPEKSQNYLARIWCWAIIGLPAKRHLMAFRWRVDDDPFKCWTLSVKTFWIRAWLGIDIEEYNIKIHYLGFFI